MKIIETKIYEFDELNDAAKEVARNWWREADSCDSDAFEIVIEDARNIGLRIDALHGHKSNKGEFIISAVECAEKILSDHGKNCGTYKTALAFDKAVDALPDGDSEESRPEDMDVIEGDFLHALLEDYRVMLDKEIEYCNSDEGVDNAIRANEYTFTEDGKRFG